MSYEPNWSSGSVISMYEEQYVIIDNNGSSGLVRSLGGEIVPNFYWEYMGDVAELVSEPTDEKPLPCPCCGSDEVDAEHDFENNVVACKKCPMTMAHNFYALSEIIQMWNRLNPRKVALEALESVNSDIKKEAKKTSRTNEQVAHAYLNASSMIVGRMNSIKTEVA